MQVDSDFNCAAGKGLGSPITFYMPESKIMSNNQAYEKNITDQTPKGQAPDQPPLMILRPALRSMWFMAVGFLLGPAIVYFGRDPEGHPLKWAALSLLFVALALHRLSLKYVFFQNTLRAESWWRRGREETMAIADIIDVRVMEGFTGRLAGCGHLEVRSRRPEDPSIIIMGQPNPARLAAQIESLAAQANNDLNRAAGSGLDDGPITKAEPPEADRGQG